MLARRSRECRRRISVLPLNFSDTASTSQDGPSLEFMAAITGRQCYIQDASDRGLCQVLVPYSKQINPSNTEPKDFFCDRQAAVYTLKGTKESRGGSLLFLYAIQSQHIGCWLLKIGFSLDDSFPLYSEINSVIESV